MMLPIYGLLLALASSFSLGVIAGRTPRWRRILKLRRRRRVNSTVLSLMEPFRGEGPSWTEVRRTDPYRAGKAGQHRILDERPTWVRSKERLAAWWVTTTPRKPEEMFTDAQKQEPAPRHLQLV